MCKNIIDENPAIALNIQKMLLSAHELGSDGAEFYSLLDSAGQPAVDTGDRGAITDSHYPRLPNKLSNTKFWGSIQTRLVSFSSHMSQPNTHTKRGGGGGIKITLVLL